MTFPINKFINDINPQSKDLSQASIKELQQIAKQAINNYATSRGVNIEFNLSIYTTNIFSLDAFIAQNVIYLPPLYFIDRNQVPFTGPDDKSLNDKDKLQKFANHLADLSGIQRKKVTWEDRMTLRLYLSAMKDVDKSSQALAFILLHEMGHSHHQHIHRKFEYANKLSRPKYVILNILTLGIFKRAAIDLQSRHHEKQADAFGAEKYAEGGRYLFHTVRKFKAKGFTEKMAYQALCISSLFTHGTYAKRESRMKAHIKKL